MKRPVLIVIPLVIVGAVATWFFLRDGIEGEGALSASGVVEATDADLGFQIPGRIERIVPRQGDRVSQGEVLAQLDTAELGANRRAAAAAVAAAVARLTEMRAGGRTEEVAQAEAALRAARQRTDEAVREAGRMERLFEGGAVSRQALDQALTARNVALAELDRAEQTLTLVRQGPRPEAVQAQEALAEQARANLARAEVALDQATLRASMPGTVTIRHRELGETVAPGTPVLTLLDLDDRWVRIYVREDRIGRLSLGMPATIRSDTYPDRTYPGEVVFIGSEAEFTPRNVQTREERTRLVYPVEVRITDDPNIELRPGIPADVTLNEPGTDG